mmetsp:Transcript_12735/g.49643  ORF Transcript_12735/g.49643 Transcript_12735/m.49643 type:complete len:257 (-) Transcript_12735:2050-2820(-)
MLFFTGFSIISLVDAPVMYSDICLTILVKSFSRELFTDATTLESLSPVAKAALDKGAFKCGLDARKAVNFVRNPSIGPTIVLVRCMMYASHDDLRSFSSSVRQSAVDSTTRGAPFVASTTRAFSVGDIEKTLSPPVSMRCISPFKCEKLSSRVGRKCSVRWDSKGEICSRRSIRYLIINSCPSDSLALLATIWLDFFIDIKHCKTASSARPENVFPSNERYSVPKKDNVLTTGGNNSTTSPPTDEDFTSGATNISG